MLDAALAYAKRGWHGFPLHSISASGSCTCGDLGCGSPGKHPLTRNGFHDASTDVAQIRDWWRRWPSANVGIRTGTTSRLLVLDSDPRHNGDESLAALISKHGSLPDTVEVITGGGGQLIYFQYPERPVKNSSGTLGSGLDIRASGGYVIAPLSIHKSGRLYSWESSSHPDDVSLAPAPDWLLDLVCPKPETLRKPAAPVVGQIAFGQRNETLASLAGSMRRRGFSEQAMLAALRTENELRCQPPLEDSEIQRIAKSIARYEPTNLPTRNRARYSRYRQRLHTPPVPALSVLEKYGFPR